MTEGQSALADVSTPGHGKGEGPAGYKLFGGGKLAFRRQMTQETVGGAGASEASGVPPARSCLPQAELGIKIKRENHLPGE